jgi:hypothetical protein
MKEKGVWSISVKRPIKKSDVGLLGEEPVPVLHFSPYTSSKKKTNLLKNERDQLVDRKNLIHL